jgi:hypothetical protein
MRGFLEPAVIFSTAVLSVNEQKSFPVSSVEGLYKGQLFITAWHVLMM